MKYKTLAICDPEKEYVSRFADYIREHGNIPMDIHIFSGLSELTDFMKSQPIEILLLSEELLRDDMAEWPAGIIIILEKSIAMVFIPFCLILLKLHIFYDFDDGFPFFLRPV